MDHSRERLWKSKEHSPFALQRDTELKWHQMNGWKMLYSKHGKGFPPDKSNGRRKREIEVEGGGRAARMEGRRERRRRDGREGGRVSELSQVTEKGGSRGWRNRKEKLKWESLQPLRRAAHGAEWGQHVSELTAGLDVKSLLYPREASHRSSQGWATLTSGCRPTGPQASCSAVAV